MTLDEALKVCRPTIIKGWRVAKLQLKDRVYVVDQEPCGARSYHREYLMHDGIETSAPMLNVTLGEEILNCLDWQPMWPPYGAECIKKWRTTGGQTMVVVQTGRGGVPIYLQPDEADAFAEHIKLLAAEVRRDVLK